MFFEHPSVTTVLNVMLNHQIKQQTNREDISTESLGLWRGVEKMCLWTVRARVTGAQRLWSPTVNLHMCQK